MRQKARHGGAYVELVFALMLLVPLMLGVTGLGISMQKQLQTVQTARDAASMYARKIDFTLAGNQNVLSQVAGSLGLTAGSGATGVTTGSSVVILTTMAYVNGTLCSQASPPLQANTSNCPNFGQWVIARRVVIGNNTLATSYVGTPASADLATDGTISITNQCIHTSNQITGSDPWTSSTISSTDLAVIQLQPIYVSEAVGTGFQLPPFSSGTRTYARLYF